jgi:hypothetical protein
MWNWKPAPVFNVALVIGCLQGCGPAPPQIAGTWSGTMMLDAGNAAPTFMPVAVTFTQDGNQMEGRWHALDGTTDAAGLVSGTVTRAEDRQTLAVRFTYKGRHPIRPMPDATCIGTARSEGLLSYNTTVDTAGRQSREQPGWSIRLKAFEGFAFDACPAIGYATWTLARQ